ncbi:hypothetical protein DID88_006777 [Monilinia fructigena]|uniref:Uncharacterized protein n=1 Tax=Monilinia fructigena TaxID=38457 RepID=A0A395IFY3_9HELO|nr:hypothetical protein DID88_006777 [Monilinia fructigena]
MVECKSNGADFGMDFDFNNGHNIYGSNHGNGLGVDPNMNGYSNTPDGDPIQSPFVHNFNHAQFRHMQTQHNFGSSLQSPASYAGSPLSGPDLHNGAGESNFTKQQRPRLAQVGSGRKASSARSPLTPKTPAISSLNIGSADQPNFPTQPIRTNHVHRHQKTLSGQWDQTPNSLGSFPGSEFGSSYSRGSPEPTNFRHPQRYFDANEIKQCTWISECNRLAVSGDEEETPTRIAQPC